MNTENLGDQYTQHADRVIEVEREYFETEPKVGLAISGGGIRSASFGLGVLQALVKRKALTCVDYLSTVSGGGYIGSSLTWFLREGFQDGTPAGTAPESFPFGAPGVGGRLKGGRNAILDYIRQHGNYLTPGWGLDAISLFGVALRSIFVSFVVYLALVTALLAGLRLLGMWFSDTFPAAVVARGNELSFLLWLAALLVAGFGVAAFIFSVRTRIGRGEADERYRWLITGQRQLGMGWTAVLVLLLVGSLPYVDGLLTTRWAEAVAGGGGTVLGTLAAFFEFRKAHKPEAPMTRFPEFRKLGANARIVLGAAVFIYGLFVLGHLLSNWFLGWQLAVLVLATAIFAVTVNLNYVGLHRMYRDRLMETFLPGKGSIEANRWDRATEADVALLDEMCMERPSDAGARVKRPYHIINTNVVLTDSSTATFRGRGGDNFILSPLFCGSYATGWRRTDVWEKYGGRRGMTLATAMAISGAAVNPHAAVAGTGLTRNRLVSSLMALLNLRLGYWVVNPYVERPRPFTPNFLVPGLSRGVLGLFRTELTRELELSDGGHFENLAIYELIRRRLKVIIVSDAGADPKFDFGDLGNAIERARTDFGAKIRFREDLHVGLDGIRPGSDGTFADQQYKLAKRGYGVADIDYADGTKGRLLFLKTTLTRALPADVYGYKSKHPQFPDETTADQFFDEVQFEAYRELGYQLTKAMLDDPVVQTVLSSLGVGSPPSAEKAVAAERGSEVRP
jgi:hypothetical protein